jgi:hypothetical protein
MIAVPFEFVAGLAVEFGCVDCFWRESDSPEETLHDRSFTGFVAEVWFESLPREFALRWSAVVGYAVRVRRRDEGFGRFAVSVPCVVPEGEVRLGPVSRGSRVRLVRG